MLRHANALLYSVLLMALLGACAVIDVVDPRYDSVNRSTAKARNEFILLNIIRARHSAPLNFVNFTRVSGSMNLGANAGLPTFNVGQFFPVFDPPSPQRAFNFGNNTLSGSTLANNSFDIGLLETKDFYTGLLSPVDLPIVNFFIRQGYSRELLFWLFADSVRETAQGHTVEFLNDLDPVLACQVTHGQRRCFSDMVDIALASGLTIEEKVVEKPSAALIARFCFDQVLADRAKKEYSPDISKFLVASVHRPRCKIDPWLQRPERDTLEFTFEGSPLGTIKYEIVPRSGFGIYQYLGHVLALQQEQTFRMRGRLFPVEDTRILAVERSGMRDCLVDVNFEDEYYCVPLRGAENTKRIMGLLTQLVALNTRTQDLAITPAFRAIQ